MLEVERSAIADTCRRAGLAFMEGVAAGWTRRELGLWLVGPYREATTRATGSNPPPSAGSGEVDTASVSDVLRETRWAVFAALEDAMHGQTKFVQGLARQRLIVKDVRYGWVAVDLNGARLRNRVLSLFAIDQLSRPSDYLHKLLACPRCEGIVFDENLRQNGHGCARVPSPSALPPPAATGTRTRTSDFMPRVTPGEITLDPRILASKAPKPGSGSSGF